MDEQRQRFGQYYQVSHMLGLLYANRTNSSHKICKRRHFLPSVFINMQYIRTYIQFVAQFETIRLLQCVQTFVNAMFLRCVRRHFKRTKIEI